MKTLFKRPLCQSDVVLVCVVCSHLCVVKYTGGQAFVVKRALVFVTAIALYLVICIGHFGKYHNTLCFSPKILHKHCFQFLLGLAMVPRENKNNAYVKFGGQEKCIMVFSEMAYWCYCRH